MPNALYALLQIATSRAPDGTGLSNFRPAPPLCHAGGMRIAALGLAAEHGAAAFAFDEVSAVPLSIAVSQRNMAGPPEAIELVSKMRHRGRNVMVTSMEAYRAGDRSACIGFGKIVWSVLGPAQPRKARLDGGASTPAATINLCDVAGVGWADGSPVIASIDAGVAGPGGILHAGALQTLAEETALSIVRGDGIAAHRCRVADATFHFVRAGKTGPFVVRPKVLTASPSSWDIEVEVVDEGAGGKTCTVCTARVEIDRE